MGSVYNSMNLMRGNNITKKIFCFNNSQKLTLLMLLIIVCVLVFIVHCPILLAKAHYFDDSQYLDNNLLVQTPGWHSIKLFFTEVFKPTTVLGYYQPLTMISLMFDCAMGGSPDNFMPFHITSLLLHVCNTALIVVLLYMLFGQPWIAAGVGLLFGLHPIAVDSIAWISDRKTLLSSFFALWSLIFYLRFVKTGKLWSRWTCLGMYTLSLMSKPTTVPLPVLMLIMDYWPLRRLNKAAIFEKLPIFITGCIFAVITYVSQSQTATVSFPNEYGAGRIPLVVCHNIIFYLLKIIWPVKMSPYYAFPEHMVLWNPLILVDVIGTCILIILIIISLHWTRAFFASFMFFFISVFPTMQVIGFTYVIAAHRFVYLPSIGFWLLLAWILSSMQAESFQKRLATINAKIILIICFFVIASTEMLGSRRYAKYWSDPVTFYEHALSQNPNSEYMHRGLSVAYGDNRQFDKAVYHIHRALEICPGNANYELTLWFYMLKTGQQEEAMSYLRDAAHRNLIPAMAQLAWILATHPDSTIRNPEESLKLAKRLAYSTNHDNLGILSILAAAWAANGQFEQAVLTAQKALLEASKFNAKKIFDRISKQLELYRKGELYLVDPVKVDFD